MPEETCPRCGRALVPGALFCPACGEAVPEAPSAGGERPSEPPGTSLPRSAWPPPGYPIPGGPANGAPGWSSGRPAAPGAGLPAYPTGEGAPGGGWAEDGEGTAWTDPVAGRGAPLAPFGAPLASWWQRVGSMVLDGLILAVPSWILLAAVLASSVHLEANGTTTRPPGGLVAVVYLVPALASGIYFSLLNGLGRGQTPGNRAPGIAVRDARTGLPIGAWRGLLRWFVRAVLYLALGVPGLVNDLFPLWDKQRQTLADKAARSVVIRLR